MDKTDLLRMLIEAYELGRLHGEEVAEIDNQQVDKWNRTKDSLTAKYEELTCLP